MIYIIGAGGFAREVLNIFTDLERDKDLAGFLEDDCKRAGTLLNGKKIDDISILDKMEPDSIELSCGIGTPLRRGIIGRTKNMGFKYVKAIHPSVIDSKWVEYSEGCIICAGTKLTTQISIGEYSIVNLNCTIGHDVKIGMYSTLSPGVHVSGRVTVGDGCFVGSGAVIVENVTIGNNSFIGAGSVVTRDVPENVLALGSPAKPVRELTETDWKNLI